MLSLDFAGSYGCEFLDKTKDGLVKIHVSKCTQGYYAAYPYSACTRNLRVIPSTTSDKRCLCNSEEGFCNKFNVIYVDVTQNVNELCIDMSCGEADQDLLPGKMLSVSNTLLIV